MGNGALPATTVFDALIGELLGDVGKLRLEIGALRQEVPAARQEQVALISSIKEKLVLAVNEATRNVQAAGEAAGADAVQKAASEQVKALVSRMALALDDLRATADKASASLRQAVEKVSIWRQIGFCAGSGAVSALVVVLCIWLVWGRGNAEGCPATLSSQQCDTYQQGVAIQAMWPHLPANIQEYLKAIHKSVE